MPVVPITRLELKDKKVLVRCDFNVPIHEGKIQDPARIDASLDTIRYILEHGGSAVLCSHLGRPKERTAELSLKPVAEYLSKVLGQKVALAPDCIGDHTGKMIEALKPGEAILLENLRFHKEEEANDRDFSHELARHKQVYVNDGFGSAHRAHASTVGVTRFIVERAAGFLMMRELDALRAVTENPRRPSVAILGGAKVSDKIGLIRNLLTKVDAILIGGAMAYTFLKAQGIAVGRSLVEDDKLELARELLAEAARKGVKIVLPSDHIVASAPEADATPHTVTEIPPEMMGLDIGPDTAAAFIAEIARAKTVIWNGPLGFFEIPAFAGGTMRVGEALANQSGVISIIGGGDTAAAFAHAPWANKFTHISTGGGATLEFLEGRELPGVKALEV
ncbi:phosphoglycerate kinase [Candidatus Binatus sp.]|jgi:phosphoglycerate kinase|uniref:phosphoglycerate kinase n=1 Tax=Candidatus Binatus sp. TaxID=2811406 RepID=UPI003C62E5DE